MSILNSLASPSADPSPAPGTTDELMARVKGLLQVPKPEGGIILNMIVKNDAMDDESHVLLRCLESCRRLVSGVSLTFTHIHAPGIMMKEMTRVWSQNTGIPVCTHGYHWIDDFADARNTALKHAHEDFPKAEWLLLLDADEELVLSGHDSEMREAMKIADTSTFAFAIPLVFFTQVILRVNLIRADRHAWSYRYAHHESLELNGAPFNFQKLGSLTDPTKGPHIITKQDGARTRDPNKTQKEIDKLKQAWATTSIPRYLFFLGALFLGTGKTQDAYDAFSDYVNHETDPINTGLVYCALLNLGRLTEHDDEKEQHWLAAYDRCPGRIEALCELAVLHGLHSQWARAFLYAQAAALAPEPSSFREYLEPSYAQWRALDLLCITLINLGRYAMAAKMLEALLARPGLPSVEVPRVRTNLMMAKNNGVTP